MLKNSTVQIKTFMKMFNSKSNKKKFVLCCTAQIKRVFPNNLIDITRANLIDITRAVGKTNHSLFLRFIN